MRRLSHIYVNVNAASLCWSGYVAARAVARAQFAESLRRGGSNKACGSRCYRSMISISHTPSGKILHKMYTRCLRREGFPEPTTCRLAPERCRLYAKKDASGSLALTKQLMIDVRK